MSKDQIKGTATETTGKAQEKLGKVIGYTGQQVKGLNKAISGGAQRIVGNGKAALKVATQKP